MSTLILQTNHLRIGYQARRQPASIIADDLNLALHTGELVCLLGPNGAGKSTLMRTLAAMQNPLAGNVLLDGMDVNELPPRALAKKMSIVLTEHVNVGLLSAYGLVALGRYPYTDWRGTLSEKDECIVQDAMEAVGATALAMRPVNELSDGERQKIMIARALAQEPQLMMLDEPTAFLDLPRRVEVMQILRKLAHERNRAILLSTHDLDLALRSADKIWLMANGRLHIGSPEDLVLSGTFAEAFAAEGVAFDAMSGSFRVHQIQKGQIDVVGDGVQMMWTVRALERAGFQVNHGANGSAMRVTCADNEWHLAHQAQTTKHLSLADLTVALVETNDSH
ncbi:MAG: ABC transporter ATP-binding protein [Chloroflexi bacterium]|nr:ABC transporter ATP-binding protein [Chloroflexota bacterium]